MKQFKQLQILTLLVFFLLLSGFVAYRSGAFEILFFRSSNSQNSNLNRDVPIDTPTTLIDSQRSNPTLLPTSKSGVIFKRENSNDPIQTDPKTLDSIKKVSELHRIHLMSSSKSLLIFDKASTPQSLLYREIEIADSIKIALTKSEIEQIKQDEINEFILMGSSKSAIIFDSKTDSIYRRFYPKSDLFKIKTDTIVEVP